jgi:hypothetical protein
VRVDSLRNGYYLVMELAEENKDLGFIDETTHRSYIIGRNAFFSFANLDTVYSFFVPNFKANIVNIVFKQPGTDQLFEFTNIWKGHKVGLVINSRLIQVAMLDISPISIGTMSLVSNAVGIELQALMSAVKAAASN